VEGVVKKVLVLGAGLVARPLVRYLLEHGFQLIVATRTVSKAEALLEGHANGRHVQLDLSDPAGLDGLITESDLVISLVPYTFHVAIARRCLAIGRSMITTSYVSNEMRALGAEAKEKGLLFLNEIGLDPGIDHMSAMRVVDEVGRRGGKILSFRSYCGGLPAQEANTNPWGYKFSWSPRGVLLAGRNAAQYLEEGKLIEVESKELFAHNWPVAAEGVGGLEGYPNRNSMQYVGLYGLEDAVTMFRGTLRYPGWSIMMKGLVDLGWVELTPPPRNAKTYAGVTAALAQVPELAGDKAALRTAVGSFLSLAPESDALERMEWVGLFSDRPVPEADTVLDVIGDLLMEKLAYDDGERDMIVLLHQFVATLQDGRKQQITSTLVDYGIPNGDSAMARTVSLPAAIAARLVLEGEIQLTGVRIPVDREVYGPVLDELANLGIECKEFFAEPTD
jgi:saccharopine dehydrogenase (NADP+, L-glutamate forming)